jgi:hypothetical protein
VGYPGPCHGALTVLIDELDAGGFEGAEKRERPNYRFFSVALAVLGRSPFAAAFGLDALASAECAAAALVMRTPGCSPFVNSTPAASRACCRASIVDCFAFAPLGQIRAAPLKFGVFGEKLFHQLHHLGS